MKFYIVPGYGHGKGAFTMGADLLDALDRWVVNGHNPQQYDCCRSKP